MRQDIIQPPAPEAVRRRDPSMDHLERILDRAVRIGPFSFGLDGVLGLIPGIGDLIGGVLSAYIIALAHRAGAPRATLARMMTNVAIDTALGAIPFAGDVFDFLFKANTKNLRLLDESLAGRRQPAKDWTFVAVFLLLSLALLAVPVVIAVMLLQR